MTTSLSQHCRNERVRLCTCCFTLHARPAPVMFRFMQPSSRLQFGLPRPPFGTGGSFQCLVNIHVTPEENLHSVSYPKHPKQPTNDRDSTLCTGYQEIASNRKTEKQLSRENTNTSKLKHHQHKVIILEPIKTYIYQNTRAA